MSKDKKKRINAVMAFMPTGRDNAVPMKYIAQMTRMSERDVRSAVNEARLAGNMIVGDDHGYYVAETIEELVGYFFRLRKHTKTTQSILRKVKHALKDRGVDPDDKGGVSNE